MWLPLGDCRLEAPKVQDRFSPACLRDHKTVEVEHIGQAEVPH
jgi:hypothetical protein